MCDSPLLYVKLETNVSFLYNWKWKRKCVLSLLTYCSCGQYVKSNYCEEQKEVCVYHTHTHTQSGLQLKILLAEFLILFLLRVYDIQSYSTKNEYQLIYWEQTCFFLEAISLLDIVVNLWEWKWWVVYIRWNCEWGTKMEKFELNTFCFNIFWSVRNSWIESAD